MPSPSKQSNNVITCKAAVAWGAGEPLVMEDVEVSAPLPGEIRIKVVCTSLCRSDISAWESQAIFPRIFGHEASGIVESIGEGVDEFKEGDHVLTVFTGECKTCRQCMSVSSFSEYTVVHSGCAVKVSSVAPLEKICLLSCGAAAGLGAAWNVADISKGSNVVIFGLGTVGLSVAQGAKLREASKIIGVDINPEKCQKAKAFGITEFINPTDCNEPIQEVIKRITNGGADYSFECIGDTGMVTTALQSCSDGCGMTVTLGVPKVKPEIAAHYGLFLTGKTLKGSLFGGWKPKSDLSSLVDMYMKKEIQIDELITHNMPFEDINKAFNLMQEGKCLRCVIHLPN
ncbi:alcohol dehydrogenase-like 6 isoform X2 [Carica papaya]|uniref:alcohol dehydrogenase-like 6 isoform X2 n=1 Tax=Carica papaya TaxID=3649 RepID=UPI000B8C7C97|nr:alcohol dehydrogenase-like 6 isoform X2 [Carica papaya]